MEELLVKINYLIREKLWCSIRTLCDNVSSLSCLGTAPAISFKSSSIVLTFSIFKFQRSSKKVKIQLSCSGRPTESSMKVTSMRPSES